MAAWKRLALESFPDWAARIEPAMAFDLSCLLSSHLVDALQTGNSSLALRIAKYTAWCWSEGAKNEPLMHLAMDILAETVRQEPVRAQLWHVLPSPLFQGLLPAFSGILKRDAGLELEREYRHAVR